MSKKLSIILLAGLLGLFTASSVMAWDFGDGANFLSRVEPWGKTAGTILNPEGKGDALMFPYFDVRTYGTGTKEQQTYFCIINEDTTFTAAGLVAKIKFHEWDKSEDIFDAFIWLSKGDAWCAYIDRNPTTNYGRIFSSDSVVSNWSATTFTLNPTLAAGWDFLWPSGYPAISSNQMGYFTVIGVEKTEPKVNPASPTQVTRGYQGVLDVPNTLWGYAYIVRVADGVAAGYRATAFANFNRSNWTLFPEQLGSEKPDWMDCEDTLDAIEVNLSKTWVQAGYDVEDVIGGKFSVVFTFPTKYHHYLGRPYYSAKNTIGGDPLWPLPDPYPPTRPWSGTKIGGYHANRPETVTIYIWDRLEVKIPPQWWSPAGVQGFPYEVTILGLYKSTTLPVLPATGIRDNIAVSTQGYETGYVQVNFPNGAPAGTPINVPLGAVWGTPWALPTPPIGNVRQPQPLTAAVGFQYGSVNFRTYLGLPVIALSIQEFQNGAVGGWYGEILPTVFSIGWIP